MTEPPASPADARPEGVEEGSARPADARPEGVGEERAERAVADTASGGATPMAPTAPTAPMAPLGPLVLPAGRNVAWQLVQWAPCRMVLAIFLVLGVAVTVSRAATLVLWRMVSPAGPGSPLRLAVVAVTIMAVHVAYRLYVRWIEWRPAGELSLRGSLPEAAVGALIGGGLFSVAVGILWVSGLYHVTGVRPWAVLLPHIGSAAASAYIEELLVRLVIFRILEELLGTPWALAVSASLFGVLHIWNANATPLSTLSITLAGALLGAAFTVTRRIWLPAALHFGWNFVQGGIFSVAVSGNAGQGLLVASLAGPVALTGGAFGVEGSWLAVALCAAATVPLLLAAARRGHLTRAPWDARRAAAIRAGAGRGADGTGGAGGARLP